jgi:hypothetical protein
VVFALGEDAAPAIAQALRSGTPRRQHAALKLAGEAQNPRLVPDLRDVLLGGAPDAAREAAQALVRIGDVSALETLAEALESTKPAIVTSRRTRSPRRAARSQSRRSPPRSTARSPRTIRPSRATSCARSVGSAAPRPCPCCRICSRAAASCSGAGCARSRSPR